MKTLAFALLLSVVPVACGRPTAPAFDLARLEHTDGQFALSTFAAFDWDHVDIFGPYTPEAEIRKIVGTSVDFPHANSEGHCLLVFVKGRTVVAAVEVPRRPADFAALSLPASFSRADARFTIHSSPDGWRKVRNE